MSERGFFAVDRGFFEHPIFAPEPFTEREAFLWMIREAAYSERRVRRGREMIELERGQFAHSLRFMATAWRWKSDARVRRFLNRLKTDAMVTVETTREATRITICNYSRYQTIRRSDERTDDAPTDARATHERRKQEQINQGTKVEGSNSARTPADELREVLDERRAVAVVEHRQRLRKPMTAHAARIIAGKLAQVPDPNAAADAMIANGWQGFEPEWLERRVRQNGNGHGKRNLKAEFADALGDLDDYVQRSRSERAGVSKDEHH